MKKFVKRSAITISIICGLIILSLSFYLLISFIKYSNTTLNTDLLTSSALNIEINNKNNERIKEENSFNGKFVKLSSLPKYVPDAFISVEDKSFYEHKGINKKRIVKAVINNIKSMSYKEGASTISQQLIKNTHLSGEKTISRKIKEITLTRQLEKKFSKDEILEFYLNIIYFGNNTYGIEEASNYYFSKESKDLTLSESALLAGMIKSPKTYSPINNCEQAVTRRNLVLNEMSKDGKISYSEAIKSKNDKLILKINENSTNKLNSYSEQAIDEAIKILKMPAKQIAIGGYKIYTYQDPIIQNNLEKSFTKHIKNNDYAAIIIDNSQAGVSAYIGKSAYKILEHKRQPGSLIKPVLVYAPALEENIITPSTLILDEELKISNFAPKNVNGKFHGYVSVKESLSKSINIPAVKILTYTGIDKSKCYAEKAGLQFDKQDSSYALALGGMTYGTTIKEITNSYLPFSNGGKFSKARFVHFITDKNGKIVYNHEPSFKQIMRDDTAYLITDMLQESAKSGTAKKLSGLNKNLASKTGTVGIKGQKQNTDAWNITYSPEHTCGIWIGNLDNKPISISGGNEPTEIAKNIFSTIDTTSFKKPSSVIERNIDLIELNENHVVSLANTSTPERYRKSVLFSRFNEPDNISTNFVLPPNANACVEKIGNKNYLKFKAKNYLKYDIFEDDIVIQTISNSSESIQINLSEDKIYRLKTSYIDESLSSEKTIQIASKQKTFDKVEKKKKWYI